MEDFNSMDSPEKMVENIREAARLKGLHEDIILGLIVRKYSGQYLEQVRSESNETASKTKPDN